VRSRSRRPVLRILIQAQVGRDVFFHEQSQPVTLHFFSLTVLPALHMCVATASYGCGRESEPASGAEAAGEAASLAQPQRPDDHGEARATAGVTKLNLQLHLSVICYKAAP